MQSLMFQQQVQSPSVGGVCVLEVGTTNIALVPTDTESRRFVILHRDIVELWAHSFLNAHPIAGSSLDPCLLPATSSLRKTAVSHRFPSGS